MAILTALSTGRALFREKQTYNKRKQKTPWLARASVSTTSYPSPITSQKGFAPPHTSSNIDGQQQHTSFLSRYTKSINHKVRALLEPFVGDLRHQQLQEITELQKSDLEKLVDRNLAISAAMFGITVAGAFIYWPISLLALPGLAIVATPIYKASYQSLIEEHRVNIDVVDSIVISVIFITGHFVVGTIGALFYFASKKLLIKTETRSTNKLVNIMGQQPRFVWVAVNESEVQIPFEQLQPGDTVVIDAGQMIPVDGHIIQGQASVDQHMLTGESQPIEKGSGDPCFASTIILAGRIYVKVEKAGTETVAAQIGKILNNTLDFKETMLSRGQEIADKSALPMLLLSTLSIPRVGLIGGATMLNSSFGYSLRMISPMMMLNFLTIASQQGILIKDGRSLEQLSKVDTVVFDKTGTLTLTQPHVGKIYPLYDVSEDQLLTYAAAAEVKQTHPIALAILHEAKARQLTLPPIHEAEYEIGYGIKVTLQDQVIYVGSARFMEMTGIEVSTTAQTLADYAHQHGYSLVYIAVDQQLYGAIELHPTIRPEVQQIVQALRAKNISLYILSGDHEQPTQRLAQELGIENYFSEVLPEEKADLITSLKKQRKTICFVGDGINDSIALKKADVSISLRGASTIATDIAQIILMNETLNQLILLFELGDQFNYHMKINVLTSIVPSIVTLGGVFIFGFGIAASVISNQIGLIVGIGNSMHPFLTYQQSVNRRKILPRI